MAGEGGVRFVCAWCNEGWVVRVRARAAGKSIINWIFN